MPKLDKAIIDRIKEAADIEQVVGDFLTLRRAGVNRTGLCPFHDDKNDGNFIVRPKNVTKYANTWHCFVCQKGGGCVEFLQTKGMSFPEAIRWLGQKYNIETDGVKVNYTPPPPKPLPPPLPTLEIPREVVRRTMEALPGNSFFEWFASLPWNDEQRLRLLHTVWQYCVGGYQDGSVVFWQIDENGVPRAAKLMKYFQKGHPQFGHRCKGRFDTSYLYAKPEFRERLDPDHHEILHPLFGAHLLKRYPQAAVNVVESEKTAVVLANYYGHPEKQLFLACGGLQWLKLESMQPLVDQQRTVWLWPDKDGVKAWQDVADKLGSDKVQVYTRFFDTCWRPEDGDKADAADITIRMMMNKEKPRTEQHPQPVVWDSDEPFLDPEEEADPRVREWRTKMSRVHSKGWSSEIEVCKVGNVKSVGEVLQKHPLIQKLLNK